MTSPTSLFRRQSGLSSTTVSSIEITFQIQGGKQPRSNRSISSTRSTTLRRAWAHFTRRLIGRFFFECRAQQPMSFQALHELIRVNDCRGNLTQDFVIGLDLRV